MNASPASPNPAHTARLWSRVDRAIALVSLAIGAALWASGWWAASGTAEAGEAVTGAVLGVAAIGAVASEGLSWVATGRRAVRARHRELADRINRQFNTLPASKPPADDGVLVALRGSTRIHREDCLLVRGKDVTVLPPKATHLTRRVRCEMCRP